MSATGTPELSGAEIRTRESSAQPTRLIDRTTPGCRHSCWERAAVYSELRSESSPGPAGFCV